MRKILILGATGAMGEPLTKILVNAGNKVYATSRKEKTDKDIVWIKGNAHEFGFIKEILKDNDFDAVVDFMNYSVDEFLERYLFFLKSVKHYIFTSSARVYARSNSIINENSPRILDVSTDREYLNKDIYELNKAREEDILNNSGYKNYTIIRPSLTYNKLRMQFALFEQNEFLDRVIEGKTLIFPNELKGVYSTMTLGDDVAKMISKLILNENAFGEIFNVCSDNAQTWDNIAVFYQQALERKLKRKVKIKQIDGAAEISKKLGRYTQYVYARGVSRRFSNDKFRRLIGNIDFTPLDSGICSCVDYYVNHYIKKEKSFIKEAELDKLYNERTKLKYFKGIKHKMGYLLARYTGYFDKK